MFCHVRFRSFSSLRLRRFGTVPPLGPRTSPNCAASCTKALTSSNWRPLAARWRIFFKSEDASLTTSRMVNFFGDVESMPSAFCTDCPTAAFARSYPLARSHGIFPTGRRSRSIRSTALLPPLTMVGLAAVADGRSASPISDRPRERVPKRSAPPAPSEIPLAAPACRMFMSAPFAVSGASIPSACIKSCRAASPPMPPTVAPCTAPGIPPIPPAGMLPTMPVLPPISPPATPPAAGIASSSIFRTSGCCIPTPVSAPPRAAAGVCTRVSGATTAPRLS